MCNSWDVSIVCYSNDDVRKNLDVIFLSARERKQKGRVRCDVTSCFLWVKWKFPVRLKAEERDSGLSAKGNYYTRQQAVRDLNPTPDAPLHLIKVDRIDSVIWAALVHPCAFMHLRFTSSSLIRAGKTGERKQIWHCEREDGPMLRE